MIAGPFEEGGHSVWRASRPGVEARFVGRGPNGSREDILRRLEGAPSELAWARQIHSATVLAAVAPGECGEGDALFTDRRSLALAVATADCVPVLVAGPAGVAAVHAGWRGLVGGVLPAALREAADAIGGEPAEWTAWVGPAIGACCYEVGDDVAAQVAAASSDEVVVAPGPAGKPHLDLPGAALRQLEAAGVGEVWAPPRCTRCDEARLWSYRRDGRGAGRNLAFLWKT
jgi:hypothetical protein